MSSLQKVKELTIKQYFSSVGINPDHVFYESISSNDRSTSVVRWNPRAPGPRYLLLSYAWYDFNFVLQKQSQTSTGTVNVNADWSPFDKVSVKEGFPISKACNNFTATINSQPITTRDPRYIAHPLAMMFGGRKGTKKCNPDGGNFWGLDGSYPPHELTATGGNLLRDIAVPKPDSGLYKNEREFISRLVSSNSNAIVASEENSYRMREPIIYPPFNGLGLVSKDMPDYCWFKKMSPMIGYAEDMKIELQFNKLAQSLFYYRHGLHTVGTAGLMAGFTVSAISEANLHLYWYRMPEKMSLPMQIKQQIWHVEGNSFSVNNGAVVNDDAQNTQVQSELMYMNQIPALILIYILRDETGEDYAQRCSLCRETATPQNNVGAVPSNNSIDNYMEIETMRLQYGGKTDIINSTLDNRELYYLTLKNSKVEDFPYDFEQWRGGKVVGPESVALPNVSGLLTNNLCRSFVALRPYDLGIKEPVGTTTNMAFRVENIVARARSAMPSCNANLPVFKTQFNHKYKLHVYFIHDKRYLITAPPRSARLVVDNFSSEEFNKLNLGASAIVSEDKQYASRVPQI